MFGKLNELNLQLQGKDKHLPHLADKINAYSRKLEVWSRHLDQQNIDVFDNLSEVEATTVIPCIKQHISSLKELFQKYFPNNSAQYAWVMDPFNAAGWYFDILFNIILIYYTCILFMLCYLLTGIDCCQTDFFVFIMQ